MKNWNIPPQTLPIINTIAQTAQNLNIETYIVGGFVRDLLLSRTSNDMDFVCVGDAINLAQQSVKKFNQTSPVSIFKHFGTAHFETAGISLEFVGARKESYTRDSRNPIIEIGTLSDDQDRRDFTINAFAISLNANNYGQLVDPFNGIEDLKKQIIKTPLDPNITFSDDPLRILRAIRFATQLNFSIHEDTYEALKQNAYRLKIISTERIAEELNKILMAKKPSIGMKLLFNTGILNLILPELQALYGVEYHEGAGHKDNFYHTLKVVDNIAQKTNNLWLRWAALLHDTGKVETKKFDTELNSWTFHNHELVSAKLVPIIFERLKLPLNEKMKYVQKIVSLHQRPVQLTKTEISDSAVRRLLFDAKDDIDDLMIHCRADITSKNEDKIKQYLENYDKLSLRVIEIEEKDQLRNWQPPISGNLIMTTFNLNPCREVGIIKNVIREAILDGIIPNEFEPALKLMITKGIELGLTPQTP